MNWDPVDQTVLANEQVIDGRGWRSGALVEQRELTQWFFKITDYAEDLLSGLDRLDRWPEKVRLMQKNWIGRSEGLSVRFVVDPASLGAPRTNRKRASSTSIPPGPTPCSAPSSWRSRPTIRWRPPRRSTIRRSSLHRGNPQNRHLGRRDRNGGEEGLRHRASVLHPFDPEWRLPVYVANFMLMEYGTGAIFGCPAHDQRDLDFVRAYGLGVTPVVCPPDADPASSTSTRSL